MDNISRHTGSNLGGLNSISWAYYEDLISFSTNDSLYSTIVFVASKGWNSLYFTPETMSLESDQQILPAGMKFIYKIKMLVPKDRQEVEVILAKLLLRKLIIKTTDKNNVIRVFGNLDSPMKLTYKLLKPGTIEGFTGYEVLFSGEFSHPAAYWLDGGGVPVDDGNTK